MLMVNVSAFEMAPLGSGFLTLTDAVPATATSPAEICAVSRALLTKVVGRALPFHWMVDPATKLLPSTVKVKAGAPATTLLGERAVTRGASGDGPSRSTILATDGTPLPSRMKSRYGPGGAWAFEGATTSSPPAAGEKVKRTNRWFMLNACVTDERPSHVTCAMLAASGVPTKNVSP